VVIREESAGDVAAIHRVNARAFESDAEARLVDALRDGGGLVVSLVAEIAGEIVGHIAFSPVTVTSDGGRIFDGVGLAPMAVEPQRQRAGIGGMLIAGGLQRLRAAGHRFCVVLGHAGYYPRHGFVRASTHGVRWERPVPDECFLIQALVPAGLDGVSGTVRYRPELDAV
jgi:putative acetyltransferase